MLCSSCRPASRHLHIRPTRPPHLYERHMLFPQAVLRWVVACMASPRRFSLLPRRCRHVERHDLGRVHVGQVHDRCPQQRGAAVGGARLDDDVGPHREDDVLRVIVGTRRAFRECVWRYLCGGEAL
eukprot:366384-Chlamydomonas_euryale.AAC.19